MAQRLVRTLCMECRQPVSPDSLVVPPDFPMEEMRTQGGTLYKPQGCRACRNTGYRGRRGIFELLESNDEIRQMVGERVPAHHVKAAARKAGMRTLRQDGWIKVMRGETTIDEVVRAAKND
jgi:general secretion pathway protein E/type IV pilus assembly protein PilB